MTTIIDAPEVETVEFEPVEGGGSIHERMVAILAELPALGKDAYNEQQRFHYRAHDDVLNALNPLLAKHGVFITPNVLERVTSIRTTSSGKAMYEVNLHVEFTFHASDGTFVKASGWGEGTDMGDKATNKAMTGAFKYVLFQTFAISTAEASDADASTPEETMSQARTESIDQARSRQAREEKREFDPGRDLLPTAILVKTEDDAVSVRQAQWALAPDENWPAVETYLSESIFGVPYEGLDTPQKREFWTRLANAVVKADDLAGGGGDFPPPTFEQVEEAYAWAFKGTRIVLSRPEEATGGDETASEPEADPEDAPPEEAAQEAAEGEEAASA